LIVIGHFRACGISSLSAARVPVCARLHFAIIAHDDAAIPAGHERTCANAVRIAESGFAREIISSASLTNQIGSLIWIKCLACSARQDSIDLLWRLE
jgi:hypothetical protein